MNHLEAAQAARIRREVSQLLAEVPLYQAAPFREAGPPPEEPEALLRWLSSLPTVSKRDLRRGFPKGLLREGQSLRASLESAEVELISTSGTTEDRLQVIWQQSWWDGQERDGMRLNALVAAALDGDYREAVLTTPVCGGATCHVGRASREERTLDGILFLNQVPDPTHWSEEELARMVDEWRDFRPVGVEADPAYLAALARWAAARSIQLSARFATLTYELATRAQRRAIATAVDAPLFGLYGATEAGVLFMECPGGRLHHSAAHSHVDLIPVGAPEQRLAKVAVTTLGRAWMPLLRYEPGDVVALAPTDAPCPCGRGGLTIARVEGRTADAITVEDRLVTAAQLDDALDAASEQRLEAWQLALSPSRPEGELRYLGPEVAGAAAARAAEHLIGRPVAARAEPIAPEGSGKYRQIKMVEW